MSAAGPVAGRSRRTLAVYWVAGILFAAGLGLHVAAIMLPRPELSIVGMGCVMTATLILLIVSVKAKLDERRRGLGGK